MKFTKIIKADENNQENLQIFLDAKAKAQQIASKYGYEVSCSKSIEPTQQYPFRQIRISKERFWPEGVIEFDYWEDGAKLRAEIQTAGYGGLDLEFYAEYLDHCHKALECLKELKETFFK